MKAKELVEWLKKLGVDPAIPEKTLKRWAFTEGIIPKPTPPKLKGPGQAADWPEEALEEAAAVWAVRHNEKGVRITNEMIKIIKDSARNVCSGGFVFYRLPPIMRAFDEVREIRYEEIQLQFAPEAMPRPNGSDAILLFPGHTKKERVELLDSLIVRWIATIAKVQHTRAQEEMQRRAGRSAHHVWPIDKKAVVLVSYRYKKMEGARDRDGQPVATYTCWLDRLMIGGEVPPEDGPDKIFLAENGTETRMLLARSVRFPDPRPGG